MVVTLLSSIIRDTLNVVREPAFFELSKNARRSRLESALGEGYPMAMIEYGSTVEADLFRQDIEPLVAFFARGGETVHLARLEERLGIVRADRETVDRVEIGAVSDSSAKRTGSKSVKLDPFSVPLSQEFYSDLGAFLREVGEEKAKRQRSPCLDAFVQVLMSEVAQALDIGAVDFLKGDTAFKHALGSLVRDERSVELGQDVQEFIHERTGVVSSTIQSPIPLLPEGKQEMRKELVERYPGSFPVFQIERSLAGGLRLFHGGTMMDRSWMTVVHQLFARLSS